MKTKLWIGLSLLSFMLMIVSLFVSMRIKVSLTLEDLSLFQKIVDVCALLFGILGFTCLWLTKKR